MMLKTELSICRKLPCSVVLLKTSAQNRGLGVLSESQQGMRKATGLLPGIWLTRSTHLSYVSLALERLLSFRQGQGWSNVWHSMLSPSFSHAASCGSLG